MKKTHVKKHLVDIIESERGWGQKVDTMDGSYYEAIEKELEQNGHL